MLTRVALLAASLAASAVLAVGLALFGLVPVGTPADHASSTGPAAATGVAPAPVTQDETVYVVPPTATPEPTPPPIIVKRYVTAGGEGDGENGDD